MWSLCMTILISGFISGVYMETCPAEEDMLPCECQEIYMGKILVGCTFDPEISNYLDSLQQALRSLRGKDKIFLRLYNIMASIPANFFSGIVIRELLFWNCRLDSLTNDDQPGLLGLEDHLEELSIFRSYVPPRLNLGHLEKLGRIELWTNNITELRDDWLRSAPPSLQYLYFKLNGITKIGSNVFSQLNNLFLLSLEDNQFGPIQRSMFPTTADNLAKLSLNFNELTYLPVDIFSGMPSISEVSLYSNGLTTLDELTWSPIWQQLDSLWIRDNNIVCDDKLNWIIKSKKIPNYVNGECSAPDEFRGMDLNEFFRRNISSASSENFQ